MTTHDQVKKLSRTQTSPDWFKFGRQRKAVKTRQKEDDIEQCWRNSVRYYELHMHTGDCSQVFFPSPANYDENVEE